MCIDFVYKASDMQSIYRPLYASPTLMPYYFLLQLNPVWLSSGLLKGVSSMDDIMSEKTSPVVLKSKVKFGYNQSSFSRQSSTDAA